MFFIKIKQAFNAVKHDLTILRQSTNDWILHLQEQNRSLKIRVTELEQRLNKIEQKEKEEKTFLETE